MSIVGDFPLIYSTSSQGYDIDTLWP